MRKIIAFLGLGLLALGCGAGINSCSSMYDQFIVAYCQKAAQCGQIGMSEEAQCEANGRAAKKYYFTMSYSPDDAIAAHRMQFNSTNAAICLEALRQSECSNIHLQADTCGHLFIGQVMNGMPCQGDNECMSGTCAGGSAGCFGTCQAFAPTGGDCTSAACGPNDFCNAMRNCVTRGMTGSACNQVPCRDGLYCRNGVCGGTSALGEPCGNASGSGIGNSCGPGLWCDITQINNNTCKTRVARDGDCPIPQACTDGLTCVGWGLLRMGKCLPFVDIGATCDPAANACPADARCDAGTMKCVKDTAGLSGSMCNGGGCANNKNGIEPPLYCDASNTCVPQVALGEACTPPTGNQRNPCFGGRCDPNTKLCVIQCQ